MNINKALLLLNDIKTEYATMDSLKEYVEAIDLIVQELEQLKRSNRIKDGYLKLIHDIGFDYDGCNTVKSLKELIDELDDLVVKALKNDDKTIMYWTAVDLKKGIEKGKNILFEEIEKDEEEG